LTSSGDDGIVVEVSAAADDEAFRAFREASDAFDAAVGSLRDTLNAIQAANHAQGDAIDALRSANQAALRLLRGTNGGPA
jgi:outer membrane protein TolC